MRGDSNQHSNSIIELEIIIFIYSKILILLNNGIIYLDDMIKGVIFGMAIFSDSILVMGMSYLQEILK